MGHRRRLGRAAWLAAASAAAPTMAAAQTPVSEERNGLYTLVVENDLFGQSDKNYTNGAKLAWMTPPGAEPRWARRLADLTEPFAEDLDVRFEFELGQALYTPEDLDRADPDPRDRPYAGVLTGSVGMVAYADGRTFDAAQLLVGVVGPWAQGGETQRFVHQSIGAIAPEGWDAQIPNRAVAALRYQHTRRLLMGRDGGIDYDLGPSAGFSLGNLQTYANLGANFRIGANLPKDFGPPRIAPALPGSGYFVPRAQWGWYAFGGVEARYAAYDVTLDERGANGAKVTREPKVADAQLGMAVHFKDVRLAYTQVLRTREFEEQDDDLSSFGAVSLTWRR